MRNQVMIPALLALSVGLAACASKPNVNLEQAVSYTHLTLPTNREV